jgi:non-specific protein-tyrosine kinase
LSDRGLMSFVERWWYILVLCPVAAGIMGFVILQRTPSVYEASETLAVRPVTGPEGVPDLQAAQALADSYAEQVRANPILTAAARSVGLPDSPPGELSSQVQARRLTNTALVRVTVQSTDPVVAADLASAVVQTFMHRNAEDQAGRLSATQDNLMKVVGDLQAGQDARNRQIDDLRTEPASASRDAQITRLQDQISQLQASQSVAARGLQDVQLAIARSSTDLSVIDPAVPPTAPVRPNRLLSVAMAILAGIFAGLGIAWLAQHFDDRLRDAQAVQAGLELPTLARIPRSGARLSAFDQTDRAVAAGFRELRSKLVALGDQGPAVLGITSVHEGEGKSTVAANLAMALAQTGRKVVLVDANLARPAQARFFELKEGPGLSGCLTGRVTDPTELLQTSGMPNLYVLTAGSATREVADPAALLLSKQVGGVLDELEGACDVLIVDTPALWGGPESAALNGRMAAVVLVLDVRRARQRDIEPVLAAIREAGTAVVGVVLNRVRAASLASNRVAEQPVDRPAGGSQEEALAPPARRTTTIRTRRSVRPATDS